MRITQDFIKLHHLTEFISWSQFILLLSFPLFVRDLGFKLWSKRCLNLFFFSKKCQTNLSIVGIFSYKTCSTHVVTHFILLLPIAYVFVLGVNFSEGVFDFDFILSLIPSSLNSLWPNYILILEV